MWLSAAIVVPVVIGALDSVPRDLEKSFNLIGLEKCTIAALQKTVLLNKYTNILNGMYAVSPRVHNIIVGPPIIL